MRVGQQLFVGSNGCGSYSLPRASAVQPVLVEVSREQRTRTGFGPDLAVVYQATSPGRATLQIACAGLCNAPLIEIAVEVRDGL
jgi:hypothetical protein